MARAIESFDGALGARHDARPDARSGRSWRSTPSCPSTWSTPTTCATSTATVIARRRARPTSSSPSCAMRPPPRRPRTELSRLVDAYREPRAPTASWTSPTRWRGARAGGRSRGPEALRRAFDVVLLDEYQDTSVAQRDLLSRACSTAAVRSLRSATRLRASTAGAARPPATSRSSSTTSRRSTASRGRLFSLDRDAAVCARDHRRSQRHRRRVLRLTLEGRRAADLGEAAGWTRRCRVALRRSTRRSTRWSPRSLASMPPDVPLRRIAILVRVAARTARSCTPCGRAGSRSRSSACRACSTQPEVLDVLSLLEVVDDVTANPAMLRLLTGARWQHRAARPGPARPACIDSSAGESHGQRRSPTLADELAQAVEGTDPTEIVAAGRCPGGSRRSALLGRSASPVRRALGSDHRPFVATAANHCIDLARRAVRALDLDIELEAGQVTGGGRQPGAVPRRGGRIRRAPTASRRCRA